MDDLDHAGPSYGQYGRFQPYVPVNGFRIFEETSYPMNKKIVIAFLCGISFTALVAFRVTDPVTTELKNSTADVDQQSGLNVFIHSKPLKKYETLGSITSPAVVVSDAADKMIELMIKRGLKDYPKAEGIIFTSDNLQKADLVKFSE